MNKKRRRKKKQAERKWIMICAGVAIAIAAVTVCLGISIYKKSEQARAKQERPVVETEPIELETEQKEEEPVLTEEELLAQEVETVLAEMTLDEKIYQMFIVTPEALTGYGSVTAAGSSTKSSLEARPVAGLIYFSNNLVNESQTKEMLQNTMQYGYEIEGMPMFLCVDEEGGRVARIGNNSGFSVEDIDAMLYVESEEEAYQVGVTMGTYLSELGFNFDFAPDADVLTNSRNNVIGDRSFGSDPETVSKFAVAVSDGLHSQNVMSTFKHFPGHGATEGDTHAGFAYTNKTYEELKQAELVPFQAAGEAGVDAIMVAHISLPQVIGDNTPCTLSKEVITDILRNDLGYEGLVITDALNMGAISQNYSSAEAAVKAVNAGVDLLLMPKNFESAVQGIKDAVADGRITEARLDESMRRIIKAKLLLAEKNN